MRAFPIGQSFQRLNNFPLDNTYIFETLIEAEQYAIYNKTAYMGQIVYVKDARSIDENGEGAENYDGLFIIDHYKTLRPLFKFILSTLKTDSGSGLTSDGVFIDTTNVKEVLDINDNEYEDDLEEIRNNIETLANRFSPFQEHLDTYQSELDILQENIDNHTHSANDIRNLESKINTILQDFDIESGIIDEEALKQILIQNGYATNEDIEELIEKMNQVEYKCDVATNTLNYYSSHIGQLRVDVDDLLNTHVPEFETLRDDYNAHKEYYEQFIADFYDEFINHFHTISQIEGDNEGDDNLRTELDKDQQDLADFKEEVRQQLININELLDEINGEIL